eukprot:2456106-Amphidinium_carterae.1
MHKPKDRQGGLQAKDKDWANLTEDERQVAKQLGINGGNAWDSGTAPVWGALPWRYQPNLTVIKNSNR